MDLLGEPFLYSGGGDSMSYFVTGAKGFIGRHLLERLVEHVGTALVLDRNTDRALGWEDEGD